MARFVFELEALLRQRLHAEKEQMTRVAEIERDRLAIEGEIRACQRSIVEEKRDLAERLGAEKAGVGHPVDLRAVRVQANASLHLITKAQRAVIRLRGVHDRLDRARLELLDRTTKRRAIELLKEKRLEEWKHERARLEQAEQDDAAVMRHKRRASA
ncbi:MAG: flagellar FliJ family protein [Phycisphaeraceae bacterium]|nr:MAG: flagellar FliJ family protein [Phycisphaeraceae bacterium]